MSASHLWCPFFWGSPVRGPWDGTTGLTWVLSDSFSKLSHCLSRAGLECSVTQFSGLTLGLETDQKYRIAASDLWPTDCIRLPNGVAESPDTPFGHRSFLILVSQLATQASHSWTVRRNIISITETLFSLCYSLIGIFYSLIFSMHVTFIVVSPFLVVSRSC